MRFGRPALLVLAVFAAPLLATAATPAAAASQGEKDPPPTRPLPWEVLDRRPAEGEQCIVCRLPVHQGDIVTVRYKGRTFHVSAKMLAEFEADPDAYFAAMEAHSGLFDEAAVEVPAMHTGWLLFGLYVLVGLVAGAACAYVALGRGLPAWGWFFAGLALNLLAVAAVLTRPRRGAPAPAGLTKIPATRSPLSCGRCGAANHPAATACSGCGCPLEPAVEAEMARA